MFKVERMLDQAIDTFKRQRDATGAAMFYLLFVRCCQQRARTFPSHNVM